MSYAGPDNWQLRFLHVVVMPGDAKLDTDMVSSGGPAGLSHTLA